MTSRTSTPAPTFAVDDLFTIKGSKTQTVYRVAAIDNYGGGRTIYGKPVDGRYLSTIYFHTERMVKVEG